MDWWVTIATTADPEADVFGEEIGLGVTRVRGSRDGSRVVGLFGKFTIRFLHCC